MNSYEFILTALVALLCISLHISILFLPIYIGYKILIIVGIDTVAFAAHQLDLIMHKFDK